jgi:hypothetical protein
VFEAYFALNKQTKTQNNTEIIGYIYGEYFNTIQKLLYSVKQKNPAKQEQQLSK